MSNCLFLSYYYESDTSPFTNLSELALELSSFGLTLAHYSPDFVRESYFNTFYDDIGGRALSHFGSPYGDHIMPHVYGPDPTYVLVII